VPCSWACKAFVWVSSWVCRAWYWVAKWVCVAWTYVVRWSCVVWGWLTVTACGLWSIIICWLRAIVELIKSVFGRSFKRRAKVDHIFVLMLENRSFDHMLGFSGLTGADSVTGAPTSADDLTSVCWSGSFSVERGTDLNAVRGRPRGRRRRWPRFESPADQRRSPARTSGLRKVRVGPPTRRNGPEASALGASV
jgi:hypothetical protein